MRDLADLDVMAIVTDSAAGEHLRSAEGVTDIVDALYALFLPDAQRLGITDYRFGKRLRGVKASDLQAAFFGGISAFFALPGPATEGGQGREVTAAELWRDVYRLAGEACVAPGTYTYGELAAMADGRRRAEWAQTANLRADLINSNPYRRGPAIHPAELDPTGGLKEIGTGGGGIELTPDDAGLDMLARFFCGAGEG
jgi:hypothetical protein